MEDEPILELFSNFVVVVALMADSVLRDRLFHVMTYSLMLEVMLVSIFNYTRSELPLEVLPDVRVYYDTVVYGD